MQDDVIKWKSEKVSQIIDMGEGTRVELDFIDVLTEDEGVLIGDSAKGFFCVLAENRETKTYPPRPFRVNAGAIHQYLKIDGSKTKYLSEIKAGDKVLVSDGKNERLVSVGRVKLEKRPLKKIIMESGISARLQNADSVFIKGEQGALHFIDLKENDEVVYISEEMYARHKGELIDEYIVEK